MSMPGLPLADVTPAQMSDMLEAIGLRVDGEGVAELQRRWLEMQPVILQSAVDPAARAYLKAESVFQGTVGELAELGRAAYIAAHAAEFERFDNTTIG